MAEYGPGKRTVTSAGRDSKPMRLLITAEHRVSRRGMVAGSLRETEREDVRVIRDVGEESSENRVPLGLITTINSVKRDSVCCYLKLKMHRGRRSKNVTNAP